MGELFSGCVAGLHRCIGEWTMPADAEEDDFDEDDEL